MTDRQKIEDAMTSAPSVRAGDWESVIDVLCKEHDFMLSILDLLDEQSGKLDRAKIPDFHLLRDIIDYLLRYPGKYHHPREDLVFGIVRRAVPSSKVTFSRLEREHRKLHKMNEVLFKTLTRICDGRPADRQQLVELLRDYIKSYREHILFENSEVFPKARVELSPSQLKRIEAKTRFKTDPLFMKEGLDEYRRLRRIWCARLNGMADETLEYQVGAMKTAIKIMTEHIEGLFRRPFSSSLAWPLSFLRGPSWQVALMNNFTRTFMKPLVRFSTIDTLRSAVAYIDAQHAMRIPDDVHCEPVSKATYQAEWLNVGSEALRKVLLYLPGGGFVLRTPAQHRAFASRLCRRAGCRSLLVHYRLAPESPFPSGLEDCLAAYHDLLDQGISPSNITIAGDSAGGGLVLSTLLALRDEKSAMPANAVLISPLGDLTFSGESRKYNRWRDPMIPNHRASRMHQIYVGNALPKDRYLSPVLSDFDGLPPILCQVGSSEVLLDDSVRASDRAKEAGVPFYLEIWREMPHVFPIWSILPESKLAIDRIARFIQASKAEPMPKHLGTCESESAGSRTANLAQKVGA